MEHLTKSPEGYGKPQKYQLPISMKIASTLALTILFLLITRGLQVGYAISDVSLTNVVAFVFAFAGSGYLHESAHYVVTDYVGYEPDFVWPNHVRFGVDVLQTKETVASLLAPQFLSVLYIIVILIGVTPALESMLLWALALNLIPGAYDVSWAIRRLTWPSGTIVILNEGENYVAFPKA